MDEPRVLINFRLPSSIAKRLRVTSKVAEEPIQAIMERAVNQYLAAHEATQAGELAEAIEAAR